MSSYTFKQNSYINYKLKACLAAGMNATVFTLGAFGSVVGQSNRPSEEKAANSAARNGAGQKLVDTLRPVILHASISQDPCDDLSREIGEAVPYSQYSQQGVAEHRITFSQPPPQRHDSEIDVTRRQLSLEPVAEIPPPLSAWDNEEENVLAAQDNVTLQLSEDVTLDRMSHYLWILSVFFSFYSCVAIGMILARRTSGYQKRQRTSGVSVSSNQIARAPVPVVTVQAL